LILSPTGASQRSRPLIDLAWHLRIDRHLPLFHDFIADVLAHFAACKEPETFIGAITDPLYYYEDRYLARTEYLKFLHQRVRKYKDFFAAVGAPGKL